jgi:hypothetical protein
MGTRLSSAVALSASLLGALPACGYLENVSTPAQGVGYAPDGTLVVFTPAGFTLYDAEMKTPRKSIQLAAAAGTVDVPVAFDLAGNGARAAIGYSNTAKKDVVVYALPAGEITATIDIDMPPTANGIPVQKVAMAPSGDLVYVHAPASGMFRVADGMRLWGADWPITGLDPMTLSPDGNTVFGMQHADDPPREVLDARNVLTGEMRFRAEITGNVWGLAATPDGAAVITVEGDPVSFVFRSAVDGTVTRSIPHPPGFVPQTAPRGSTPFTCTSADDLCASAAIDPTIEKAFVLLFKPDGTLTAQLDVMGAFDLAFSPDGALLAVAGGDARVFRVADGTLVSRQSYTYGLF